MESSNTGFTHEPKYIYSPRIYVHGAKINSHEPLKNNNADSEQKHALI